MSGGSFGYVEKQISHSLIPAIEDWIFIESKLDNFDLRTIEYARELVDELQQVYQKVRLLDLVIAGDFSEESILEKYFENI